MSIQPGIHEICNECLRVQASEKGAELWSICGADGAEYLWQGDPRFWEDRSPTIFPYVARLTEGMYTYGGHKYSMPIHGLAPYAAFEAEAVDGACMRFILNSDAATLAAYPFPFRFTVEYRLSGPSLTIAYIVENRGEGPMHFGAGVHPGINVPLEPGVPFESYALRFDEDSLPQRVNFTPDCFVAGGTTPYPLQASRALPLRHDLFDEDAIILKDVPRRLVLSSPLGTRSVTFAFDDYPIFGLWHWPRREAPYVCLEAWTSLPSRKGVIEDLSTQPDLVRLEAGGTWRASVKLTMK